MPQTDKPFDFSQESSSGVAPQKSAKEVLQEQNKETLETYRSIMSGVNNFNAAFAHRKGAFQYELIPKQDKLSRRLDKNESDAAFLLRLKKVNTAVGQFTQAVESGEVEMPKTTRGAVGINEKALQFCIDEGLNLDCKFDQDFSHDQNDPAIINSAFETLAGYLGYFDSKNGMEH